SYDEPADDDCALPDDEPADDAQGSFVDDCELPDDDAQGSFVDDCELPGDDARGSSACGRLDVHCEQRDVPSDDARGVSLLWSSSDDGWLPICGNGPMQYADADERRHWFSCAESRDDDDFLP